MSNEEKLLADILHEIKESRKDMQALTKAIHRLADSIEVDVG